jgi:SET domain-containing protein
MSLLETSLIISTSTLKDAGMGLFTNIPIAKGTLIVEYKGKVTTWKKVLAGRTFNGYVYYITRNHVIDARPYKKHLARYANDADGLSKVKGVRNNCVYSVIKKQVYIQAVKNIPAGSEIFVSYGKDYWNVVKENAELTSENPA